MQTLNSYRLNAQHCRTLAEAADEEAARRVLLETAEHWDFLADVTELHSSPRFNSLRIEFDHPAPLTVRFEQPRPSSAEGRDRTAVIALARRQLDDLDLRIARQSALIDRLQDRKSMDMANAILESFLSVRQSVQKHLDLILRAEAAPPPAGPSEQ
jgi:hypothetical protein